jgi:glycosyl transferase family 25
MSFDDINTISDIKNVHYINLNARPDRKIHVENELNKVGFKEINRFSAIKMANGALGCSMSHLKLLEMAKLKELDHILIVEDDILFTNPELFIQQFNWFLRNHKDFDVVLLAGNNYSPYTLIDDSCVKISNCQTTTGYLVKKSYYDKLIENIKNGISKLVKQPHLSYLYCIDQYWKQLQKTDKWYLVIPLTVIQKIDYSDINKKNEDYSKLMLSLDKK